MDLKELSKPLPLKWRVQRAFPNKENPTHVIMVGYLDARDVQDRLDEVVGQANWQTKYYECKSKQFCEIGIYIKDIGWVWKGDSGTQSQTEKEKGETSDAFKRAAVHWGINRSAYQVGEVKMPCRLYMGKPFPCDDSGTSLKGEKLFEYCNKVAKVEEMEVEFEEKKNPPIEDIRSNINFLTTRPEIEKYLSENVFVRTASIISIANERLEQIKNTK